MGNANIVKHLFIYLVCKHFLVWIGTYSSRLFHCEMIFFLPSVWKKDMYTLTKNLKFDKKCYNVCAARVADNRANIGTAHRNKNPRTFWAQLLINPKHWNLRFDQIYFLIVDFHRTWSKTNGSRVRIELVESRKKGRSCSIFAVVLNTYSQIFFIIVWEISFNTPQTVFFIFLNFLVCIILKYTNLKCLALYCVIARSTRIKLYRIKV